MPRHFDLVKKAMEEKRQAYVIVNNRSEGNAPLTIQALRKRCRLASADYISRLLTNSHWRSGSTSKASGVDPNQAPCIEQGGIAASCSLLESFAS